MCVYVCMYVCMCVCLFVCLFVCVFVCLLVCLFVCVLVCVLFVCLFACQHACFYACMYVCMYAAAPPHHRYAAPMIAPSPSVCVCVSPKSAQPIKWWCPLRQFLEPVLKGILDAMTRVMTSCEMLRGFTVVVLSRLFALTHNQHIDWCHSALMLALCCDIMFTLLHRDNSHPEN